MGFSGQSGDPLGAPAYGNSHDTGMVYLVL